LINFIIEYKENQYNENYYSITLKLFIAVSIKLN